MKQEKKNDVNKEATENNSLDEGQKYKAIEERNRIALAYIELAKDKVFQKLEEEKRIELIKEVISIGDEVAEWVIKEYETNDPRKIANSLGVRIFGEDQGKAKRSEYRK
jgi:uncharacterized tellurite resistance protein B-like protein